MNATATATATATELDRIVQSCENNRQNLCGVYLRMDSVSLRMVGKLLKTPLGYRLDTVLDPMDLLTNEIEFATDAVSNIIGSNVYLIRF